jgi:GNAT superfamily N-acetyltransferase
VVRSSTAVAAVFPSWAPLNNAIVLADPDAEVSATTASGLAGLFTAAHVDSWALWLRSTVTDLQAPGRPREIRGLSRDTTTLVTRANLPRNLRSHEGVRRTSLETATRAGDGEPVPRARLGEPEDVPGLSSWVMVHDRHAVAGAWSFLHHDDCGIYAVGTAPAWRRQGFARALVEHVLADARRRGARTASLQSTEMGRPLYESLGFEPVGRYEEWLWNRSPTL